MTNKHTKERAHVYVAACDSSVEMQLLPVHVLRIGRHGNVAMRTENTMIHSRLAPRMDARRGCSAEVIISCESIS